MKIGFIGAGNMGSALAKAARKGENEVLLYDTSREKAEAVAAEISARAAERDEVCNSDVIFLAVKPNILPIVSEELKGKIKAGAVLISVAAGVTLMRLEELFPSYPIIRIMPNTPAAVGCGMIVWCKNAHLSDEDAEKTIGAMSEAGNFLKIDEEKIDAATAVSGCGPAFVYMFIDALIKGGVEAGLSPTAARELASRTVIGAGKMVEESDCTPEALRIAVCSPGGSTIEGVKSLMANDFEKTVMGAVESSFRRTKELGK